MKITVKEKTKTSAKLGDVVTLGSSFYVIAKVYDSGQYVAVNPLTGGTTAGKPSLEALLTYLDPCQVVSEAELVINL